MTAHGVFLGKVWQTLQAHVYYQRRKILWREITHWLDNLRAEYDLIIVEGVGGSVELNLKPGDLDMAQLETIIWGK